MQKTMTLEGTVLRLKVNKQQEKDLMRQTGACRFVYNYFLALQKESYKELGSLMSYNDMSGILTQLKYETGIEITDPKGFANSFI